MDAWKCLCVGTVLTEKEKEILHYFSDYFSLSHSKHTMNSNHISLKVLFSQLPLNQHPKIPQ